MYDKTRVVLDEYEYLRSWGLSREECACKLGIKPDTLNTILKRAGELGDPRSDWCPKTKVGAEREAARSWPDDRISALRIAYGRELRAGREPTDLMRAAAQEYDTRRMARRRGAA